jgi:predicted permease
LRDLLVTIQVSLALTLLVGAGLLIRSLQHLLDVNSGIRPDHVLSLQIAPPPISDFQKDFAAFSRFYQSVNEAVRDLPGVESAAVGSNLPFSWSDSSMMFFRLDKPIPEDGHFLFANTPSVSKDYFQTLGIPLLRGRLFDDHEPIPNFPAGVAVTQENFGVLFKNVMLQTVISQHMAEQCWPGEDPLGKRFQLGLPAMHLPNVEVIGIVGDITQHGLENGPTSEFYLSIRQFATPNDTYLILRSPMDPTGLASSVRTALNKTFPGHPIYDVRPMIDRVEERVSGRKFNLHLFVFFAGTALLLAVIGLYGVLAFLVGQQTREIGIRMALGAKHTAVWRDVLRRGLILVAPGLVLGGFAAWTASRFLQSQLYAVTRNDPLAYACAAGLLLLAAIVACLLPARRATQVNPIEALRAE